MGREGRLTCRIEETQVSVLFSTFFFKYNPTYYTTYFHTYQEHLYQCAYSQKKTIYMHKISLIHIHTHMTMTDNINKIRLQLNFNKQLLTSLSLKPKHLYVHLEEYYKKIKSKFL